jgi:hypothetical protein
MRGFCSCLRGCRHLKVLRKYMCMWDAVSVVGTVEGYACLYEA